MHALSMETVNLKRVVHEGAPLLRAGGEVIDLLSLWSYFV